MNPALATEMEARITEMLARLCPAARGRTMYGGTMFETDPGVPKTGFCGVFCYKQHVSLAFSRGALLADPEGSLEGNGKLRRHIKLMALADLEEKAVENYLKRAIAAQP